MPGKDLRQIMQVGREYGMDPAQQRDFGKYVEECKSKGDYGSAPNGDFTMDELREKAREFLDLKGNGS